MKNYHAVEKLCELDNPFSNSIERDQLFLEAIKENYAFQAEKQPYIEFLAKQRGFSIEMLNSIDDISKIPPLFVGIMKINSFCNFETKDIAMVLTSSGTKGQKTQSFFDSKSLDRLSSMAHSCFKELGWTSNIPAHIFVMGYDIREEKNLGTSWSNNQFLSLAPNESVNWTILKNENGEFEFDSKYWARKVVELGQEAPIRFTGFPAFMSQLAYEVAKIKPDFKAKEGSFITAGGGWKNHKGVQLTHKDFAALMEENLGIPKASIRDTFGMAEHGVPFCSCSAGNYHIPIYSRILIRDPLSLKVMPNGQEGLMNLITPYNMAQPNISVLATDLAIVKDNCSCGIKGNYITSIRRGGVSKNRGCAIAAQELLDKK